MSKQQIVSCNGKRYMILRYLGFKLLGIATSPELLEVAVPLSSGELEWLAAPRELYGQQERTISEATNLAAAAAQRLIKENPGFTKSSSAWLDAKVDGAYKIRASMPFLLFRGDRNESRGILPSLYRPAHTDDFNALLSSRLRREWLCAKLLKATVLLAKRNSLQPSQSRAAARHFGAPSTFVDFSFNPNIAAQFASHVPNRGDIHGTGACILYALRHDRLASIFPVQGFKVVDHGLGAAFTYYIAGNVLHVPYLAFDSKTSSIRESIAKLLLPQPLANVKITLRTTLVPGIRRIEAQQGMFVEITGVEHVPAMMFWYVLDFITDKWCLLRENSTASSANVIDQDLFPKDGWLIDHVGAAIESHCKT